ncbi:MAG: ABC transporter ATP-binding protein, partial [Flavisolibacter sp.]
EQQISIVVSTPYMDEAKLCDRIALIQTGKIMSVDKPDTIVQNFPKALFAAKAANLYKLLEGFRSDAAIESCYAFGEYLHLTFQGENEDEQTANALAGKYHAEGFEVKKITQTIEDCFIRLMNSAQLTVDN